MIWRIFTNSSMPICAILDRVPSLLHSGGMHELSRTAGGISVDHERRTALAKMIAGSVGLTYLDRIHATSVTPQSTSVRSDIELLAADHFNAKSFGARGDGSTDDTVALQNWINFLVANQKRGLLVAGTYLISRPLNVPSGNQWAITGDNAGSTRIVQISDNVPILNIGSTGSKPLIHSWRISDIEFDYANIQPASNENANPIIFSQMVFEFSLLRLRFINGSYAIKVKPGVGGPWGGVWDELVFGNGLTAGAMKWAGCLNGVPNNKWGRFFVDCKNMVGPVFMNIRGYNWIIDTIEFVAAQQGATLFSIDPGSMCTIGAVKLENGTYRNPTNLVSIGPGAHVQISQFSISGNAMVLNPTFGTLTLFATSVGGPTGSFEIDTLVASATEFGGNVFVISGLRGPLRIRNLVFDKNPWKICDNGSTATGDTLTIDQYKNDRVSSNIGDKNYSVQLGVPNILSFESKFSMPRFLDLPAEDNSMFSGLYYEIRLYGSVNGENTLTIRCAGMTKFVAKTDKVVIRFSWRRASTSTASWIMTAYQPLP